MIKLEYWEQLTGLILLEEIMLVMVRAPQLKMPQLNFIYTLLNGLKML